MSETVMVMKNCHSGGKIVSKHGGQSTDQRSCQLMLTENIRPECDMFALSGSTVAIIGVML